MRRRRIRCAHDVASRLAPCSPTYTQYRTAGDSHLVIVSSGGIVSAPGLAFHPPLSADGHPFETTEIDIPPGSILLLHSGGTDARHTGDDRTAPRGVEAIRTRCAGDP
jgi:hypothetical protein